MRAFSDTFDSPVKIIVILGVMVFTHLAVVIVRKLSKKLIADQIRSSHPRIKTIASLTTSITIFTIYFGGIGLVLKEFGVSLTAYLASASILGLAIGFGSQGLVQDVVTGLTLIFSNLLDVGDMVEISGQVGIVRSIGVRFTVLENSYGAEVYIPNRTITNVLNYPQGYVRCMVDITLSNDSSISSQMEGKVTFIVSSTTQQYPGIFLKPPSIEGHLKTNSGRELFRVKFCLWPGRGVVIETSFKQEVIQSLKVFDPSYADWMVSVNYDVEKKSIFPPSRKD